MDIRSVLNVMDAEALSESADSADSADRLRMTFVSLKPRGMMWNNKPPVINPVIK